MLEWKQVDTLPGPIPCDWHPFLRLEKAIGCRLFRLRLNARPESGDDLIVRVRRGNFKALRRSDVDYQALVPLVDDLKAIAATLRMTPLSEQRKIKRPPAVDLHWPGPEFQISLTEMYQNWARYISPPQWTTMDGWVVTTGDPVVSVDVNVGGTIGTAGAVGGQVVQEPLP